MQRVYLVPRGDWLHHLAEALRVARRGDWVLVADFNAARLAMDAASAMDSPAIIAIHDHFMARVRGDYGMPDFEPVAGEWTHSPR